VLIKKILFTTFLLFSCASQATHVESTDIFFRAETDRTVDIYTFDGFRLNLIDRTSDLIKEKIPVSEGNYFALFFVKDGYVPEVKVLQADKKDIEVGKIRLKESMESDKGFLVGVVYKPVRGGKVSYRKGISVLLGGVNIMINNDKGQTYSFRTRGNGAFIIPLVEGRYWIALEGSRQRFDVLITNGKTTIQNLQRGLKLID